MSLYKNKYRIETTRLKEWDYSNPWWYYITINTKSHIEWFGEIKNGKMILNSLGKIVSNFWENIPNHFPIVELDYSQIMPNHIHGIIIINPSVETPDRASLHDKNNHHSLGLIINQFKGSFKKWCNENNFNSFEWQPRFYDRIIRNEKELYNIRKYIKQNPIKWEIEKEIPENLDL